jgi:hypothetical protein
MLPMIISFVFLHSWWTSRSESVESFRAYQNGPLEPTFYQEAATTLSKDELNEFSVPSIRNRPNVLIGWS